MSTAAKKKPAAQDRLEALTVDLRDLRRYMWRPALRDALADASADVSSDRFYDSVASLAAISAEMLCYANEGRRLRGESVSSENEARGAAWRMPEAPAWHALHLVARAFGDARERYGAGTQIGPHGMFLIQSNGLRAKVDYQHLAADALAGLK